MNWNKSVHYGTIVEVEGEQYGILCIKTGDTFELLINGEYICDLFALPEYDELRGYIDDKETLDKETLLRFPRS